MHVASHSEGSQSPEDLGWVGTSPPPGPALGTGPLQNLLGALNEAVLQATPAYPFPLDQGEEIVCLPASWRGAPSAVPGLWEPSLDSLGEDSESLARSRASAYHSH